MSHGSVWGGRQYTLEYTVYNIKSIEYLQSPLEKTFHVERVRICGDTVSGQSSGSIVTEETFTVYGVKDFENTAEWMRAYIQLVE